MAFYKINYKSDCFEDKTVIVEDYNMQTAMKYVQEEIEEEADIYPDFISVEKQEDTIPRYKAEGAVYD